MIRTYKLAANFNTVEFTLTEEQILEYYMENYDRHMWPAPEFDEDEVLVYNCPTDVILRAILQEEYDVLARIEVINIAPDIKQSAKKVIEPPSKKQADFARALGMIDPEKHDKKEVWKYIQEHKNDD